MGKKKGEEIYVNARWDSTSDFESTSPALFQLAIQPLKAVSLVGVQVRRQIHFMPQFCDSFIPCNHDRDKEGISRERDSNSSNLYVSKYG